MSKNERIDESKNSNEIVSALKELIKDGMNKSFIKCIYCNSEILSPQGGTYLNQEFALPLMTRRNIWDENKEFQHETVNHFWQVKSIYTFENMGFSKTVEKVKYLTCADCESGPLGYFNDDTKISYLALGRVKHVE